MSDDKTIIQAETPSPREDILIAEQLNLADQTLLSVFRRKALGILKVLWTVFKSAMFILPAMLMAGLTLDISFRGFDGPFDNMRSLAPGNWLSQGGVYMLLSVLILMWVTRRYGAVLATRAIAMSWLLTIFLTTVLLLYLAPQLSAADLPSARYVVGFVTSWLIGQIVVVHMYDLTRGGKWWRAPLYGGLFGMAAQTMLFFPIIYMGFDVPWLNWMVTDITVKTIIILAFLVPYHLLRRTIKPFQGLGGL